MPIRLLEMEKAASSADWERSGSLGLRATERGERHKTWALLLMVIPCLWLFSFGAQAGQSCSVQNTADFFAALSNLNCSTVLITGNGFVMDQAAAAGVLASYSEHRVRLFRNVTIRGELPYTLWDVAFLKRRIGLEGATVLTLESLLVPNGRQPSATSYGSLDIVSMSPSSVLVMRNVTLVYPLCFPTVLAAPYTTRVQRPTGFPGTQAAHMAGPLCLPDYVNFRTPCFSLSMVLKDLAIAGSSLDSSGVRLDSGVVLELDTVYVCQEEVSSSCILNSTGTRECVQQAIERYRLQHWELYDLFAYPPSPPFPPAPPPLPPPPPAPPAPPSPPPRKPSPTPPAISSPLPFPPPPNGGPPLLAIVLPCVLGGLVLLAAPTGVAYWWQRRRGSKGYSAGAGAGAVSNGYSKSSNGVMAARGSASGPGEGALSGSERVLFEIGEPRGDGYIGADGTGGVPWVGDGATPGNGAWPGYGACDNGVSPKWSDRPEGGPGGMSGSAPRTVMTGIMSSMQSGCTATTVQFNGLGGGGASAAESLLGNPLLVPPGGVGRGSSASSGPGIALNLVLGVDVFASREAVVGRGSFATVLEGQMGGRPVAVKLFHRDALGGTADDLKSLKQEIAILARCQHPHVVALLGAGSTAAGDEVFLVEELMVSNLARACHEGEGLSLQRVLSVARDVAAGLAYLHPTVIHRDLKPANVLLDMYGTAKLTDFGLSRLWASTVHTANPEAGTVQYMAPECFSGSLNNDLTGKTPITHLSDIYSFGVLLWEMLTRERPWKGLSSIQVALAVGFQHQRLKIPETDDERLHPKLRKLILQCWDADPRKRPGAAEIAKRLSLLLQHLETHGSLTAQPSTLVPSLTGSMSSDTPIGGSSSGPPPAPVSGGPVSGGSLGPAPGPAGSPTHPARAAVTGLPQPR